MKILRPDQIKFKADIYAEFNAGAQHVVGVAPTGFGKSVSSSDITRDYAAIGATQCVIAHRNELVSQMSLHIADVGVKHRIIAPKNIVAQIVQKHRREFGRSFINPDANCAVAGVDTLIARADALQQWCNQVDFWTIDECHHVLKQNKWGKAVRMFPRARGLGITATLVRSDGYGLGADYDGVFNSAVYAPTMRELINLGALCEYDIACPQSDFIINDDDLPPSGDFTIKKMRAAAEKSRLVGDVVKEYVSHAYGKQAICFATDIKTAGEIAQRFTDAGIPAASVSSQTPERTRDHFVERFRDGKLWVLINVDLFGEGFDVPACEVVIMARPTASLGLYLQMFGRALRLKAGKLFGLIIDHVGNVKRHGLPDKPHFWSLARYDKKAKKERDPELLDVTICKECTRPYEMFHLFCPFCGAYPPLPAVRERTIEMVAGDLTLMGPERLAAMRAALLLPSPADVGARTLPVAGAVAAAANVNRQMAKHAAQQRLAASIQQWGGIQRWRGRSDSEAYRRFYHGAGVDVISALTLDRTEMEALADKVDEWCRA